MYYSKKIFSTEKLNSTRNKQTNFNGLGPLSRIFPLALRGMVMQNLLGKNFLSRGGNPTRSDFDDSNLFQS